MKSGKIIMILLIVGLLFLVGCSNNDYNQPPTGPTGAYVGGGCGVAGIPVDVESMTETASEPAIAL